MKRTYLAALCVAIILVGLQTSRGVVSLAGVGAFWLLMLPRPRAVAVYSTKRPSISHAAHKPTTHSPSAIQEKRV